MSKKVVKTHSRSEVIRDTFVLQLKLIVDGFRDLLLMPAVFFATVFGLIKHQKQPGRYMYRLLSYGKVSEKWIGLFDDADKDIMPPIYVQEKKLDDLLKRAQTTLESKYIDEQTKSKLLNKLDVVLDEINQKMKAKPAEKPKTTNS
ncbi:MAG TPA: hypothetical protein PK055_08740 [Gammaproteobacteria bacterium]|nr:hypothetical protein [Gammaproteobacteria bacterium]HPI96450.1 hypothetical protein [Gammaproteobacteria bacterium]HPQ87731.1 hypothetical protein [Gammaproteobacteria bacterium]